jgi:DNA-binding NtrC family response regulator
MMKRIVPRVMIIDDDEEIHFLFRQIFKHDLEVLAVKGGDQLLSALKEAPVDLLIMDHRIGNITSADLIPLVRLLDSGGSLPIVLYSGTPDLEYIALSVQAAGFIKKPAGIDSLRLSIRHFLGDKY